MTTEKKTYAGGCHCGAVRYEVDLILGDVIVCNCSVCGKSGSWLAFVTPDNFRLLSGEEVLTEYRFNKQIINHNFCKICGIKSFACGIGRQGEMRAINVRCLDGVDLERLNVMKFDGKSV